MVTCGDVEANPGPAPSGWGEEDYAVVPDLVVEAWLRESVFPTQLTHPPSGLGPLLLIAWTKY